ncbi:beta family protein [Pseudomonas sp. RC3H12]|uniref:beta family protein n=1 Tax=Pseudomonas sp. RC3H12 TaxID=2834406 RepID=UPI001BDDFEB7|nr:beta family protein [Pseudomonas sp. RC3H12]QWA30472.1 hypothetical protein KHO27_06215 [Pseudomonas sp. RC3H12]
MERLDKVVYAPSIRSGQYDLLAISEIEDFRRPLLTPIISARGDNLRMIHSFAEQWTGDHFWIDSSRFSQDSQSELPIKLNDPSNNFQSKLDTFRQIKAINDKVLPIVGFRSGDRQRNVVQFALKLYSEFSIVGIRVEGSGVVLDKNISTARALLNAISDDDLKRTVLIIDAWSINEMPSLQEGSSIQKMLALLDDYEIGKVITVSTSWPDDRPDRGTSAVIACIDPYWQAIVRKKLLQQNVSHIYGDYAATNPTKDLLDDYDPTKMAQPIPFAGYYSDCQWHQERRGAGGENEKYREIAEIFRSLPNYHGDTFCWGTKAIAAIGSGNRVKSGNMAFWNKIRINQHACAMLGDISNGILDKLANPHDRQYDDLDDLI